MKFVLKTIVLLVTLAICVFPKTWGQNLESIGKDKPLKITGGLSANQILHGSDMAQSGRSPYTYYLAGNINFNLYGWSVPFSYTFSNQQSSFQQPFNQYSLHPTYKWITLHLGYTSMTFSSYTLSGHQFLGAGVDLNPGSKFKFSAMYGRLKKEVELDTSKTGIQPVYRRYGFGLKGGVNLGKVNFELMTFHSKDVQNSLKQSIDSLEIYPEENLVLGINSSISPIDKLSFQVEYGTSFITRDIRSEVLSNNLLYTKRTSTERFNAVKAGLKYAHTFYSAGVTYERIDPGYRTHGSYYFNNDLENIATNLTASLFKKKLTLGANIGVQRDDLDKTKMSTMLRVVNSYNIGFVPINQLNISATYSNFKSHTNVKPTFQSINQLTPYETLDTLNFTQISENASLNVNYTLSSTEKSRQNLSVNGTYQKASEYQDQVLVNSGAKFMSSSLAHNLTFVKSNTSFTTTINYSNSITSTLSTYTVGPTLSVRKSFLKNKLRGSLSTSFNNSYSNGSLVNTVFNFRMNWGYTWQKKHNFNFSGAAIQRIARSSGLGVKKVFEYTFTLGYTYNF